MNLKRRETEHSLRLKQLRNIKHSLKNEPEELPNCMGWFGTSACLHNKEITAGWAGEPGSYKIKCFSAEKCKDMKEPKTNNYLVWFGGVYVEAENTLQAFHKAVEIFKENPICDYIEMETPDGAKTVAE